MKQFLIIAFLSVLILSNANCQIDTSRIIKEVNSLKSIEAHKRFWKKIYADDQGYRGESTNDEIDKLNLIKSCIYLNTYGYPDERVIKESSIISYVWIHNKFPKVDILTFPIILGGYRTKQIKEKDFRNYYARSIYRRLYHGNDYKHLAMPELLKTLGVKKSRYINIDEVLKVYEEEKSFLEMDHYEIGVWNAPIKYDTLYLNEEPIIHTRTREPIKIFRDSTDNYYFLKLYADRGSYPQKIMKIKDDKMKFKLYENSDSYFKINDSGNLEIFDANGKIEIYITTSKDEK